MECTKIKFETAESAREEIERILNTANWKPWKDKKPNRWYLCTHCNSYHLTSQPFVTEYKKPS